MIPRREPQTEVVYDSPAGLIRASAGVEGDRVTSVAFQNVPAFRYAQGLDLTTRAGSIRIEVSYGGAFYAWSMPPSSGSRSFPKTRPR